MSGNQHYKSKSLMEPVHDMCNSGLQRHEICIIIARKKALQYIRFNQEITYIQQKIITNNKVITYFINKSVLRCIHLVC